jgi:hypothetical protein
MSYLRSEGRYLLELRVAAIHYDAELAALRAAKVAEEASSAW